jgi:ubiquitin C-terminal hydrolase
LIVKQNIKFRIVNDAIFSFFSIQKLDRLSNSINKSLVKLEEIFDLSLFIDILSDLNNYNYSVKGLVNYKGDLEKRHYWSNIKIKEEWYEVNDSLI